MLIISLFCLPSQEHLEALLSFVKVWHANMSITTENEKWGSYTFWQPFYQLPIYHLPSTIPCLVPFAHSLRCFRICSIWSKLHTELFCLEGIFLKNGYPEYFINNCFKKFMDDIHVVKETTLTAEISFSIFNILLQYSYKLELCWRSHLIVRNCK